MGSRRTCGLCKKPVRGAATLVYAFASPRRLLRVGVCKRCAGTAVQVIVGYVPPAPIVCAVCGKENARLCERCVMRARKAAVKSALASTRSSS